MKIFGFVLKKSFKIKHLIEDYYVYSTKDLILSLNIQILPE